MASEIPERREIPVAVARARLKAHFAGPVGTHAQGWDDLWKDSFIPWDRRAPNPALQEALAERADSVGMAMMTTAARDHTGSGDGKAKRSRRRALVPGCGRGYDVYLLAAYGWDAIGLEVSAEAVRSAEHIREPIQSGRVEGYEVANKASGKGKAEFVVGNFFEKNWLQALNLPTEGVFDLIYDYTFLCALPPDARPQWAAAMSHLLSPSGRLLCLEFPLNKEAQAGGPPWAVRPELYTALLAAPGQEVEYDDDGYVKYVAEVSHSTDPAGLERIGRWQPAQTHEVGRGHDMMSVWGRAVR